MGEVLLGADLTARDPGDDALLTAFAGGLPGRELTLLSAGPTQAVRRGHRVVALRDRRALISALRRCRVLVLGDSAPWGARSAIHRNRARQALGISLAAKALGSRVALLGVGAGQLERGADRAWASALVRLSDLLVLRGPRTAEALAAAGAPGPFRVASDPAWCALKPVPALDENRKGVLVILDSEALPADGLARLATGLDLVVADGGLSIDLAPWRISRYGSDDLDLARSLAARMAAPSRVLLPPAGFDEARAEAARARVVLGLRLHALVVAAGAGTPAVMLSDDPEAASLAERLSQPTLSSDAAPATIAAAVLAAADGAPADETAVRAEKSAAQHAFRLLRLLLDAEHSDEDHELVALPLMPESTARPDALTREGLS